jgi:Na+/melibiose symporter-like transporter
LSDAARARERREAERLPRGEEGFWFNFKRNMGAIWWALGRREIYLVVIYFLVDGFTNPTFGDYSYFFLMNIIGVSKFMFAMITLIGSICSIVGVLLYEAFLKTTEVRTILIWNVALAVLASWLNYCFAMRWNLEVGISDYAFILFTDVVFGAITTAFGTLPLMALFAKITPKGIEGTIFAFLTGGSNLDQGIL